MADREKALKGLRCCSGENRNSCRECPYDAPDEQCMAGMAKDALELIREQKKEIERLRQTARFPSPITCRDCGYAYDTTQLDSETLYRCSHDQYWRYWDGCCGSGIPRWENVLKTSRDPVTAESLVAASDEEQTNVEEQKPERSCFDGEHEG
jgi:hypothetical protein